MKMRTNLQEHGKYNNSTNTHTQSTNTIDTRIKRNFKHKHLQAFNSLCIIISTMWPHQFTFKPNGRRRQSNDRRSLVIFSKFAYRSAKLTVILTIAASIDGAHHVHVLEFEKDFWTSSMAQMATFP